MSEYPFNSQRCSKIIAAITFNLPEGVSIKHAEHQNVSEKRPQRKWKLCPALGEKGGPDLFWGKDVKMWKHFSWKLLKSKFQLMNKVIVIIILAIIAQPRYAVRITEEHCGIAKLMGSILKNKYFQKYIHKLLEHSTWVKHTSQKYSHLINTV